MIGFQIKRPYHEMFIEATSIQILVARLFLDLPEITSDHRAHDVSKIFSGTV